MDKAELTKQMTKIVCRIAFGVIEADENGNKFTKTEIHKWVQQEVKKVLTNEA